MVLTDIRAKAEIITLHEEDMIRRLAEKKQTQSDQELACIQKTAKALNKRLAELDKLVAATYEDKVKGAIPEAVCIELLNKYQSERNEKNGQLKELKQQMESAVAGRDDIQAWADLIRQYRNLESLDRETVLRLIDHIEIGEKKIVNGQKEQEIRIHYKFVGYIG